MSRVPPTASCKFGGGLAPVHGCVFSSGTPEWSNGSPSPFKPTQKGKKGYQLKKDEAPKWESGRKIIPPSYGLSQRPLREGPSPESQAHRTHPGELESPHHPELESPCLVHLLWLGPPVV